MPIKTEITEKLGITHPILLAPMDIVSGTRLTAAVSLAGGFGILGGGYGDESWLEQELGVFAELVADERPPFGIGFITWSLAQKPDLLHIALEAGPQAIMLSFGDPKPFADSIKRAGAKLICQVQSEDTASEALEAGADMLVAQGTEAGGHGGSRTTMDIIPAVVDLAVGRVPVVAAGGIADGRGLASVLMLGAEGILLGTRFYASEEADGHDEAKKRICAASGDETIRGLIFDISRQNVWPLPFTGRCLLNDPARRWVGRELELIQNAGDVGAEYENAKAEGNFDIAAVVAGQAVGLINDIPPAGVIVERIVTEAQQILGDRRNSDWVTLD